MNPRGSLSVLVVEPNPANRQRAVTALTAAGFQVTTTDSFDVARQRIVSHPPAVLVAALKLGEYNGLHLVLRAKTSAPRMAALVTADDGGAVFRKDAQQAGATFVMHPVAPQEFLAAVLRTLFRTDPSEIIEPPFERRVSERRQASTVFNPDRRATERRRDLNTLLQMPSFG